MKPASFDNLPTINLFKALELGSPSRSGLHDQRGGSLPVSLTMEKLGDTETQKILAKKATDRAQGVETDPGFWGYTRRFL